MDQNDPLKSNAALDAVVLLHGLFATRRSMLTAEKRLEREGYLVINWGYRTFWRSVDQHAQALLPTLTALESDAQIRSINFLTHSMGAILARYALEMVELQKIKRMVMLAPPNTGSHLTRISLGPFSRMLPAIAQLSESPDSLPNRLPDPKGIEVGIIAASSDFIVRVANTFLASQSDHCVVNTTHFALPTHEGALRRAIYFLAFGRFSPGILPARKAA